MNRVGEEVVGTYSFGNVEFGNTVSKLISSQHPKLNKFIQIFSFKWTKKGKLRACVDVYHFNPPKYYGRDNYWIFYNKDEIDGVLEKLEVCDKFSIRELALARKAMRRWISENL